MRKLFYFFNKKVGDINDNLLAAPVVHDGRLEIFNASERERERAEGGIHGSNDAKVSTLTPTAEES